MRTEIFLDTGKKCFWPCICSKTLQHLLNIVVNFIKKQHKFQECQDTGLSLQILWTQKKKSEFVLYRHRVPEEIQMWFFQTHLQHCPKACTWFKWDTEMPSAWPLWTASAGQGLRGAPVTQELRRLASFMSPVSALLTASSFTASKVNFRNTKWISEIQTERKGLSLIWGHT